MTSVLPEMSWSFERYKMYWRHVQTPDSEFPLSLLIIGPFVRRRATPLTYSQRQ